MRIDPLETLDRATGSFRASTPGAAEAGEADEHHNPGRRFGRGWRVPRKVCRKRRALEPVEVIRQPRCVRRRAGQQGPRMGATFVDRALGYDNPFVSSEPEASGSRRSTTTVPPKPIGWPAESVVFLVATSAVFEISNSLRDVIDVPKAGPQSTGHLSAQSRPDSDSFWGGSRPLLGKSESAKP